MFCIALIAELWRSPILICERKGNPGGRGQLRLRSYASAHPMILAIMTSLLRRPVKLQWPLKSDTRKVFHPMIAQRV